MKADCFALSWQVVLAEHLNSIKEIKLTQKIRHTIFVDYSIQCSLRECRWVKETRNNEHRFGWSNEMTYGIRSFCLFSLFAYIYKGDGWGGAQKWALIDLCFLTWWTIRRLHQPYRRCGPTSVLKPRPLPAVLFILWGGGDQQTFRVVYVVTFPWNAYPIRCIGALPIIRFSLFINFGAVNCFSQSIEIVHESDEMTT